MTAAIIERIELESYYDGMFNTLHVLHKQTTEHGVIVDANFIAELLQTFKEQKAKAVKKIKNNLDN